MFSSRRGAASRREKGERRKGEAGGRRWNALPLTRWHGGLVVAGLAEAGLEGGRREKGLGSFGHCDREIAANGTGQMPFHFIVPGHSLFSAGTRVYPDRVTAAFTHQGATLLLQMGQQLTPLHIAMVISSAAGSSLSCCSRSVSSSSRTAALRSARHSSFV